MYQPPMPLGSSGALPSPRRQIPFIPGDPKLAVALRALHVDGVTRDGRAGAADGADRVASAPMVRQVLRVLGTQHDGPVARPGKECLQEAPRHANTLAPRHLEDRVLRRQSHDAIPGAAPEAAVHVLIETGPSPGQGVSRWHHACNLSAALEAVNP